MEGAIISFDNAGLAPFEIGTGASLSDLNAYGGSAWTNTKITQQPSTDYVLTIGNRGADFYFNLKNCACEKIDVALTKTIKGGKCQFKNGDLVTFVIKVFRQDGLDVPSDSIVVEGLASPDLVFVSFSGNTGSYDKANRLWKIPNISKSDTAITEITFKIDKPNDFEGGLICSEAWVKSMKKCDIDSNPGDKNPNEDDYAKACVSISVKICKSRNEKAQLIAPDGFTTYQWFLDGNLIMGANQAVYETNSKGSYTVQVDGNICLSPTCCPITVEEFCACLPNICVPIQISKTLK